MQMKDILWGGGVLSFGISYDQLIRVMGESIYDVYGYE